jgi:chromate reductase
MKVLGIVGSLRKESWNRKLWRLARKILEGKGVEVTEADIGSIPLYNADVQAQGYPPPVAALREAIKVSDALVLASPEYNNSVPGVLKNAIDWASRQPNPFPGKLAYIMGVSTGQFGAARAHMHLGYTLESLSVFIVPQPRVLIAYAERAFTPEGELADPEMAKRLEEGMTNLIETTRRLTARD